jgi:hypothetical protein
MTGKKVCILIPKMIMAAGAAAATRKASLLRDVRNSTPKVLDSDDAHAA